MARYKNRKGSIKIFIAPFIIISLIFVIILFAMGNNIKKHYYDLKQEEALKIANNISVNLTRTGMMTDTANKLLEDNLLTSLKATALHSESFSDELLIELGDRFEIDEIYVYNPEGIIEYSYSGKYIGWEPYKGHTMDSFINGDEDIFIEDIRKDSDSDLYYKYGYIKIPDGSFVQIGILAEKVLYLLDSFELQNHLEEMLVDKSIIKLFALDGYYRITASTDKDLIGSQIDMESIRYNVGKGKIYDRITTSNEGEIYEVFVPLDYESDIINSFGIQYSMDDIGPIIRNNTMINLIGLLIIYLSLIFSLFMTYNRNKRLIELAFYDSLTGLPNTESLKEQVGKDIIKNKENKSILMIKCSNLNLLNITFGYEYGNLVLKEIGNRFKLLENKDVQLFKFTADKFVLYIRNYKNKEEVLIILKRIKELLNKPFIINRVSEGISAKIGIVEFNKTDKSLDQLLKHATIALNYGDANGNGNYSYSFFDEDMELAIQREETIEKDIKAAISEENSSKIHLVYQPIVDIKSNRIDGFEALIRMKSEEFGHVSPVELINIAERQQLIIPLSNLILKEACMFISDLVELGYDNIRVSVNISTIHLLQEDFVSTLLSIIKETGIKGRNLELEITETTFMGNFQIANERLRQLRENDIRISLDDFGTGYSSFYRLSELNVNTVKIDRHFIDNITKENKASIITKDIISIAHKLGLTTIAEGVETEEQKNYLLEYNCDKYQGYMFSKAVGEKEAIRLLKKNKK